MTLNYDISYTPGALSIQAPTATYTVYYYYDGELQSTATQIGTRNQVITTYPPRLIVGYRFDRSENLPLKVSLNAASNVINIYYVSTSPLATLEDMLTPLGGNTSSNERGTAIE